MNGHSLPRILALAALLAASGTASAGTYRVDDSASTVLSSRVDLKWDPLLSRRGQHADAIGHLTVISRLDVSRCAGKQGRIYMLLPSQPSVPVLTSWTTRGQMLPGTLRDGGRTLVFSGMVPASGKIEDTLELTIQADVRRLTGPEQLTYTFEIDVDTP